LSNERLVNKRLADFIMVRKASEAGTLDRLVFDPEDRELQVAAEELRVASCQLQASPSGSIPAVGIVPGDPCDARGPCDGVASVDGITPGEDDGEARPDDATLAEVDAQTRAVSHQYKTSCSDENFCETKPNSIAAPRETNPPRSWDTRKTKPPAIHQIRKTNPRSTLTCNNSIPKQRSKPGSTPERNEWRSKPESTRETLQIAETAMRESRGFPRTSCRRRRVRQRGQSPGDLRPVP